MVSGHLQEKKGYYYIVLNLLESVKDGKGCKSLKRKSKWIPTGLTVKGNKKRAEAMMLEARLQYTNPENCDEIIDIVPECANSEDSVEDILFSDFILDWLEMVKNNIELSTYAGYYYCIAKSVAPYFKEAKILLKELKPKHIQDYYTHEMNIRGVSANTVIHYHANIRKALQYAVKTDMILSNPADKVDRPKINKFMAGFYTGDELGELFKVIEGTKIELAVYLGSFYGLRRSEAVGLKWSAIDFKEKTISIRHIVTEFNLAGKTIVQEKDRTKNKASHRTLPLVPQFEQLLHKIKEQQINNRKICGRSYNKNYLEYIYVDELGDRIRPGYITQYFPNMLEKNDMRRIRFHDLRHSCASLLLANGVPMKQIQDWLGHSDFSTTANIYAHLEYSSKISSATALMGGLQDGNFSFGQPMLKEGNG